jgi:hypothetical protein
VWNHDTEVRNNDRKLPTLLLSNFVQNDFTGGFHVAKKTNQSLPCHYSLDSVDTFLIEKEKEAVLYERMRRKTAKLNLTEKDGFAQVLYELLATAFGAKVNRDPFWQLSREIPIKRLLKLNPTKRVEVICETSGLNFNDTIYEKKISEKAAMSDWQWKRKGLHPKGFPEIRIAQFAHFIKHFEFDFGFLQLSAPNLLKYLDEGFSLVNKDNQLSKSFKNLVIMNSFVPFIWWLGEKRGEVKWHDLAFELLQLLPAESNHITKLMKSTGFEMHSAYDSQSLLELYNQRCTHKKCLSCSVGNEILNQ